MVVSDLLELTLQRFKIRALRIFLTMFGIGIGIAIVYFLVSFGFGLQDLVIGRIATSDSLLAIEVSAPGGDEKIIKLNKESLDHILEIDGVEEYSPSLSQELQIKHKELISQTVVQGTTSNFFRLAGIDTLGNEFSDSEADKAVVTTAVLTIFEIEQNDAIGKEITVTGFRPFDKEAEDQNVYEDKEITLVITGLIEDQNNILYSNIKIFDDYEEADYNSARVKVANQDIVEPIKQEIQALGFQATALTDTLDQLNKIFSATQAMFAAFGIVALFISAVGMFNTMTISLLERTREIGIMKAIGATRLDIWQMFLLEAVVIGFIGGVLGILMGFLGTQIVNFIINRVANQFGGESVDLFSTPAWFLMTIVIFSLVVGVLTGLFPARRAAKIDPLEALRYE